MMKKVKGSVTVFAMILLGLMIGMYLFGFSSPIISYVSTEVLDQNSGGEEVTAENLDEQVVPYSAGKLLEDIRDQIFSEIGLAFMGLSLAGALITGFAGAGYIGQSILNIAIPVFILNMICNIMFYPVANTSGAEGLPPEINILLVIVFNVLMILTTISFVMGRD